LPGEVRDKIIKAFDASPLKTIFTEKAELTNSRAAMIAMGAYLATAVLF
jgi:hypothetical protein